MNIIPCKGCFRPGEPVSFRLSGAEKNSAIQITVTALWETVCQETLICQAPDSVITLCRRFPAEGGYGVSCRNDRDEEAQTAFDIQQNLTIPRYGFLSDFFPEDEEDEDILAMAAHHINLVQFYDWSYRHDSLVAEKEAYTDMMGKRNALPVIRRKIAACHAAGMRAMAYGAVYAASENFACLHPEWRLYAAAEQPLRFIDVFSIMNLRSGWKEHIISQYGQAIREVGFDGIHMDTYGFPKTALDDHGTVIHLEEDFPRLIADARAALPEATLVFNNVGAWPLEETMRTDVQAVYVEVWPPYDRYCHLKQLLLTALGSGKPVILAAYPAAFRTGSETGALYSELILLCLIQAHGATQLWFGEENATITQGYYSDYSKLTARQQEILKSYDDFFVRYESLFFDRSLKDVSMTHFGWDNQEYTCKLPCSVTGEPGKLWLIIRESRNEKLISVLNLRGLDSDLWAGEQKEPEPVRNVELRLQCFGSVSEVRAASPEDPAGDLCPCRYELTDGDRSQVLKIMLPCVRVFSFIWIRTENA